MSTINRVQAAVPPFINPSCQSRQDLFVNNYINGMRSDGKKDLDRFYMFYECDENGEMVEAALFEKATHSLIFQGPIWNEKTNSENVELLQYPSLYIWKGNCRNGLFIDRVVLLDSINKVIFEGIASNSFNALLAGEGTVKNFTGKILFEGSFSNGVPRHGKMWYSDGSIYEGDFDEVARKCGQGTLTNPDHTPNYSGDWKNDLPHGKGKKWFSDGSIYIGDFAEGKRCGFGKKTASNGKTLYIGAWRNNLRHGRGKEWLSDGGIYLGNFVDGKKKGLGREIAADGTPIYTGEWKNNKWHGSGKHWLPNGVTYEGNWVDGCIEGQGTLKARDGTILYEGEWKKGFPFGDIITFTYVDSEGNLDETWKGSLVEGKFQGKVSIYLHKNRTTLEGNAVDGELEGDVAEKDSAGRIIYKGNYSNRKKS